MIASRRDGEITFYEELGLTPGASAEQIRDAFRLYVRLVHPDQHTDPQLKEVAEAQMRKLNRIYAVLSDSDERRLYDERLNEERTATVFFDPPSPAAARLTAKIGWGGAIILSTGILIWLAADSQPGVPGRLSESGNQTPSSVFAASDPEPSPAPLTRGTEKRTSSTEIRELRVQLQAAIDERDAALHELNRLRGNSGQNSGSAGVPEPPEYKPTLAMTELPQLNPRIQPAAPPPASPRTDRPATIRQLAGFWFYVKPALGQNNKNRALYPPEYIEATIVEDGGILHGKLRARFEIVDRAISPDVNFTFTGTQAGQQATGPWIGAGGSKGDVNLKLTSDNTLRIDWTANELGTQLGLSSGTAILTRRIE
jgi:curved DNA-binding protein CbpA